MLELTKGQGSFLPLLIFRLKNQKAFFSIQVIGCFYPTERSKIPEGALDLVSSEATVPLKLSSQGSLVYILT